MFAALAVLVAAALDFLDDLAVFLVEDSLETLGGDFKAGTEPPERKRRPTDSIVGS
jgi:hypothetical protein